MKKIFILITAAGLLTACGGNSKNQENTGSEIEELVESVEEVATTSEDTSAEQSLQEETVTQEEEDEGIYNPPFKVTIVRERKNFAAILKTTYVFNVMKNGRLSGSTKDERCDERFPDSWETTDEEEFGGKWSSTSISMGDGRLKVYALDPSNRKNTIYLPATCDYIWLCEGAWIECENWNTSIALKVTSVEKL